MYPYHGLAQLRCLPDERLLTGRQIDVRAVHALSHGGNRAGAVLSAQRQNQYIRLRSYLQRFPETGSVRPCLGISVCINHLRNPGLQFLQEAFAMGVELA